MNDVSDAGVIFQNALSHVIEEFREIVGFVPADFEELYFQAV
jgi:hypothetical protein